MVAFGIYFSRFGWYKVQNAKPRARPSTAPSQTRAQQEAALTFHSLLGQFLTPATHAGLVCTEPGLTLMPHLGGAARRAPALRPALPRGAHVREVPAYPPPSVRVVRSAPPSLPPCGQRWCVPLPALDAELPERRRAAGSGGGAGEWAVERRDLRARRRAGRLLG